MLEKTGKKLSKELSIQLEKLGKKIEDIFKTEEEIEQENKQKKQEEYIQKGRDFEIYVKNLFPDKFSIVRWTTDIIQKHDGTYTESDTDPDFILRYKPTDELFAVECKFRSYFTHNKDKTKIAIKWSYPQQMERYKKFEKEKNIPVMILIGIGKNPKKPDYMFLIPLKEIKYPTIYGKILEKYERKDTSKKLFWNTKEKILK